MRLNIGCQYDYREGWVNLDIDRNYKLDVCWDLNKFPYPFKDNTFDEIMASFVLEQITDTRKAMKELHRIGKQKCKIYISTIHGSFPLRNCEHEHRRGFSRLSFGEWFCNKSLYPLFKVLKRRFSFTRSNFKFMNLAINPIINFFPKIYERLFSYYLPCGYIVFILEVRKDREFMNNQIRFQRSRETKGIDNLKFIKEI